MIYLDTSVLLAQLFAEDCVPPASLWESPVVSSRLLAYEAWTRLYGRGLGASHAEALRSLLQRITLIELAPEVLARAIEPFPSSVRTLDALHLATFHFLREQGQQPRLASYDERMLGAAAKLGFSILPL